MKETVTSHPSFTLREAMPMKQPWIQKTLVGAITKVSTVIQQPTFR